MQSVSTCSRSSDLEPLLRVEARVVQQRRRAAQPRGDEDVARRLRPARGGGAPRQPPGARREPVLGLDALAGEVALPVQHRLRLAGGAGGEGHEARVLGLELDRRMRRGRGELGAGDEQDVRVGRRLAQHAGVALVADDQPRARDVEPRPQVGGAQLLGARERDRADAEAREHRQHPLRAVADERHHDVAAADAACHQGARRARRRLGDLAEAPLAARAVAAERDERPRGRRRGVDDVAREVHRAADPRQNGVRPRWRRPYIRPMLRERDRSDP